MQKAQLGKIIKKGLKATRGKNIKRKKFPTVKGPKKGIDPKTGYRYGYKPHYLSKEEARIAALVGGGGSAAIVAKVIYDEKKKKNKKPPTTKPKKQLGGIVKGLKKLYQGAKKLKTKAAVKLQGVTPKQQAYNKKHGLPPTWRGSKEGWHWKHVRKERDFSGGNTMKQSGGAVGPNGIL